MFFLPAEKQWRTKQKQIFVSPNVSVLQIKDEAATTTAGR